MKLLITKRQLIFLILLASSLLFQSYDHLIPKPSDNTEQDTLRKNDFFKKYSIKEQQEDLKLLKEALEKIHPNLYWNISKEEFEKEYTSLFNGITNEKTAYQYAFYIRNLFGKIRCTHSGVVGLSEQQEEFKENNLPGFPFNVKVIDNKLYIKDNFTKESEFNTGAEILSINGVKTDDLLKEYIQKVHNDGFNKEGEIGRVGRHFKMLTEFKFDFPASYSMEVLSPNGTAIKKNATALSSAAIEENYNKKYPKEESASLKIIDSLKTAVLTFTTFEIDWRPFLESSFKKIQKKKIQNLIIDVRKNRGGYDLYSSNLYAYLASAPYEFYNHVEMRLDSFNDPIFKYAFVDTTEYTVYLGNHLKKLPSGSYIVDKRAHPITAEAPLEPDGNPFRGKVFILTSYLTSSAASELCAIAHFKRRATFIGQETGGAYCGGSGGKPLTLNLPNTKIQVWIPIAAFYTAVDNCESKGGIKPDYEIKANITDLDHKVDREMNFALDLIKKQQ